MAKKKTKKTAADEPAVLPMTETAPAEAATTPPAVEPKARRKGKAKPEPTAKKMSAIDAAAKVLGEAAAALNCQEMIAAMAEKGYWSSPGGKTPASTLYSAILREIQTNGKESRFEKSERGKFVRTEAGR